MPSGLDLVSVQLDSDTTSERKGNKGRCDQSAALRGVANVELTSGRCLTGPGPTCPVITQSSGTK